MKTYDPSQVGKRIAWGRSHSVYRYGETEVIKFPKIEAWIWGDNLPARIARDAEICKKYLGEYFVDTRTVIHPLTEKIATIQQYVAGEPLTKNKLKDPEVRKQFDDFLRRYSRLLADGYPGIDLIGPAGVFQKKLNNILIQHDRKLRLIDAVILDVNDVVRGKFILRKVSERIQKRQAAVIQRLFA